MGIGQGDLQTGLGEILGTLDAFRIAGLDSEHRRDEADLHVVGQGVGVADVVQVGIMSDEDVAFLAGLDQRQEVLATGRRARHDNARLRVEFGATVLHGLHEGVAAQDDESLAQVT